ncbi:MAG: tetratricopeptide repeat protein, partial [Synechococcales cyanobacterium RM1_1_8]|nr:tetratricopeptide repeat protein [Synechococcales cyanobacterium RM1_1_8]
GRLSCRVAGGGAIAPASLAEEKVASTSELTVQAAEVLPFVMAQDSSGASEELEAAISEGNRLFNEGSLESQKEAIFQFEKAIKLSEAANQKDKQAYSLVKLAQLNTVLNNKQNALNLYDQSLLVYRALGDVTRESITLNSIGAIYDSLGKKEKALDYYNQSLLLSRAESDYSREAATLNNIGAVYKDQGNYVEALSFYQQSLILNRRLKNLLHQIDNLNNIGEIYGFQGKYSQALSNYLNALKIFENSESILEGGLGVMIRQRSTLLSVDHFTKEFKKHLYYTISLFYLMRLDNLITQSLIMRRLCLSEEKLKTNLAKVPP